MLRTAVLVALLAAPLQVFAQASTACGAMPAANYMGGCTAATVRICSLRAARYVEDVQRWRKCRAVEIADSARDALADLLNSTDYQIDVANRFRYCIGSPNNPACPF